MKVKNALVVMIAAVVMTVNAKNNRLKDIEKSLVKRYKKNIYKRFLNAIKDFDLISEGDTIAVCISGGKDSFVLAKCMQELQIHSYLKFNLKFIVMDPGYAKENLKKIKENLKILGIDAEIYKSNIFEDIKGSPSMCYLCARKRRGSLYAKAEELGCNKIALGHHFNDVIETILLNMIYAGEYKTMMPKLHSEHFENMELIRPLYYVKEEDIISFAKYNKLEFLDCACTVTKNLSGKRKEVKDLVNKLISMNENADINLLRSSENVYIDQIIGYKKEGKRTSFLDDYRR